MLPVPVSSANPFMSPLSCLTPLCPRSRAFPGWATGSRFPFSPGEPDRGRAPGWEKPRVLACSEAPAGEGTKLFPGAEPSHPHLSLPLDAGNLGSPAREPLGSGCNQRRERGEVDTGGGTQASWESLAAAGRCKDLEMSSRLTQRVPSARLRADRLFAAAALAE